MIRSKFIIRSITLLALAKELSNASVCKVRIRGMLSVISAKSGQVKLYVQLSIITQISQVIGSHNSVSKVSSVVEYDISYKLLAVQRFKAVQD